MADIVTDREAIQQQVEQMINLSMTLSVVKKETLKQKLSTITEEQLDQLASIFAEEKELTNTAMTEFFSKHPKKYAKFERAVKNKVHSIYMNIEQSERPSEEQRMETVITSLT